MTRWHLWSPFLPAVLVAAMLSSSGCGTATIEDAVPVSAAASTMEPPEAATASAADTETANAAADASAAFARPGDYPNLNVIPKPAAEHITAEEKAAESAQLRATRDRQLSQGRGSGSSGDAERLRRLAASHADDTLKAIEGQ